MIRISDNIINYYKQFGADEKLAKKAYRERSKKGSYWDKFLPHGLPDHVLERLKDILRLHDIGEVYLVQRKVTYVPQDPLWVVIIKTGIPWYHIRLGNPAHEIGNYVGNELQNFFEKGTCVVTVDFPMYLRKARSINGSLIYQRARIK